MCCWFNSTEVVACSGVPGSYNAVLKESIVFMIVLAPAKSTLSFSFLLQTTYSITLRSPFVHVQMRTSVIYVHSKPDIQLVNANKNIYVQKSSVRKSQNSFPMFLSNHEEISHFVLGVLLEIEKESTCTRKIK